MVLGSQHGNTLMGLRKKSQNPQAQYSDSTTNDFFIQQKLRSSLQDQMLINDGLKSQLFQKQLENEDLRQRLVFLETTCGRDSSSMNDTVPEESGKIDWARILLDQSTDDLIISVSREKIAHEMIRLRTEVKNLRSGLVQDSSQNTLKVQSERQLTSQ